MFLEKIISIFILEKYIKIFMELLRIIILQIQLNKYQIKILLDCQIVQLEA